jgi:hypothetical protein
MAEASFGNSSGIAEALIPFDYLLLRVALVVAGTQQPDIDVARFATP